MNFHWSDRISLTRNRRRRLRPALCSTIAVVFSFLASAPAAVVEPAPSHTPTLLSLRMVPEQVSLQRPGASQHFVVMGTFADGLDRDLTSGSRFHLSDTALARVDDGGRVVALAPGEVTLRAESGGHEVRSQIRIDPGAEPRPFRFDRDIASILTKRGCNASECHGSVKGQGGFKLSLDGLYPEEDHEWIVKGGIYQVLVMESGGPRVPRVNPEHPEQSLLLKKATMQVGHVGGERIGADSADYATLLDWIRKGAEYGDRSEERRIERVTVFPREAVLDAKGVQQLLVTAYGPDGRSEDISHQARYVSQNPHVVTVDENGRVTATGSGETTVLVRTAGHAVSARFGVVDASAPVDFRIEPRNLIDKHVFAKLRKFQIRPSELSSDSEFLRRVCLDITGTLPPPDRVREFLADRDPRKRDKLIETLLDSPQYADYWSFLFADLFRVTYTTVGPIKEVKAYDDWVRNGILQNKPYDRMARERIAAQGYGAPTRHFFRYTELIVPHEIMAEQVRLFMGRRLDCAQCHNHPFETWSQDQFWGMTAFFGNVTQLLDSQLVWDNPEGGRSYDLKQEGIKTVHPRRKEEVRARFMDGSYLTAEQERDPRMALAEWIIAQPAFAETVVNRVWGYFFGRGIVDPVDDFKVSNPPTHPVLLSALAEDFVEHGYDLKHLMRLIVRSRTYQTSGVPNRTNREDGINYSRALARPLQATVLLDAISHATGVPEEFPVHPKTVRTGAARPGARAIDLIPELFPCHFLDVYGRSMRKSLPEKPSLTLTQALHMWAGSTYTTKITQEGGRLDRALKDGLSDSQIIEDFYLAALSRYPTERERSDLEAFVREGSSPRPEQLANLMWALISSREFAYNH